jgi:hypothetical protein
VVREYPSGTAWYRSIGHATGMGREAHPCLLIRRNLQAPRRDHLVAKYARTVEGSRSSGTTPWAHLLGSARAGSRCGQPWWSEFRCLSAGEVSSRFLAMTGPFPSVPDLATQRHKQPAYD